MESAFGSKVKWAMAELPDGTVTFFFTDIEGSTRMVREVGDDLWAGLLETHRELVRRAIAAHGGREFGTQGDALFAVFARATDAAAAAVGAQQALESHPWSETGRVRIRIGLHSGEAVAYRDNYVGKEVHRAARICDAGHGGQVLVSARTAALVQGSLPDEASLRDLGAHRLKDMGDPERLFQLTAPGLPSEFSRLRTSASSTNLPAARSSFVGRAREMATVRGLLEQNRLVSLTGVGGSGKTRIATEVGSLELARFVDGVFFVDLAPLADPDLVAQATAASCAQMTGDILRGDVGGPIEDRLVAALATRSCLFIVDNCEHLIDAAADLVDRILLECPDISLLITSREALGLEGERIVPVPSLALPSAGTDDTATDDADAVRLFVERAQSVKPAFSLADDTRGAVVEICRRLDGIPLAIELAATRVAHLSVQQIADRLEDRFRLLTGGRRRIQRQQTLGAALDWSHDLLDEEERRLLRRLAVFAGGFTLEAAEAIATGDDIPATATLEIVGSLVGKSLVLAGEGDAGETRYHLLETVRMYVSDKLTEAGEAEILRTRHRDWYLARLEAVPLEVLSASAPARADAATELDNLRAGADWSMSRNKPSPVARFASHLADYWNMGAYREGSQWLLKALEQSDRLTVAEQIECHSALTGIAGTGLDREMGRRHATRAIELARDQPSPSLVMALAMRGFLTSISASAAGAPGELAVEARKDCREAVEVAGRRLHPEWRIRATAAYGMAEATLNNQAAAAAQWGEVLALIGDAFASHALVGQALPALAVSHLVLGNHRAALEAAMEGFACFGREPGGGNGNLFRCEIAPAMVAGGQEALARELLLDELPRVRRPGVPLAVNQLLGVVAVVDHLRGRSDRAARLLATERSLGGADDSEIPFRTPGCVTLYVHYLPLVRFALGPEESRRARREGQAMNLEEALRYAEESLTFA